MCVCMLCVCVPVYMRVPICMCNNYTIYRRCAGSGFTLVCVYLQLPPLEPWAYLAAVAAAAAMTSARMWLAPRSGAWTWLAPRSGRIPRSGAQTWIAPRSSRIPRSGSVGIPKVKPLLSSIGHPVVWPSLLAQAA